LSRETPKQNILLLLVPAMLGLIFILIAVLGVFSSKNIDDQLFSGFFLIPGTLILLLSFREFKVRREGKLIIKHDERSEINRLKATDWGFKFLFVSLMILIVLNTLNIIDEIVFVAMTGPVIAIGVAISFIGFYWFERRA
jgi:hypothetical protein